jgi:hypothetical protein
MRNVRWTGAGLCLGLLVSAGPSFADGAPPQTTPASAAAPAPARGLRPPIHDGAVAAKGGVEVAVLRQSCSQTVETEQSGNDLVEAIVELEVRNGRSAPIDVHRDAFQLVAPDGGAIRTSTWFAGAPRSVDPGQAQTFELRFMSRGGLNCYKEMILQFPSAVVRGTDGVKLDAIRLVPARRLPGYDAPLN